MYVCKRRGKTDRENGREEVENSWGKGDRPATCRSLSPSSNLTHSYLTSLHCSPTPFPFPSTTHQRPFPDDARRTDCAHGSPTSTCQSVLAQVKSVRSTQSTLCDYCYQLPLRRVSRPCSAPVPALPERRLIRPHHPVEPVCRWYNNPRRASQPPSRQLWLWGKLLPTQGMAGRDA